MVRLQAKFALPEHMFIRLRNRCGEPRVDSPRIVISPESGSSSVEIVLRRVDLPAPLGPRMPKISPWRMVSEIPWRARAPLPKVFLTSRMTIASIRLFYVEMTKPVPQSFEGREFTIRTGLAGGLFLGELLSFKP